MRSFIASPLALLLSASPVLAEGVSALYHNGSQMRFNLRNGRVEIRYAVPKASLFDAGVTAGTLLFRGQLEADGQVTGEAFTYKRNCAPAPYVVSGVIAGADFVLQGSAPHRARYGCDIIEYTDNSGHANLVFDHLDPQVLAQADPRGGPKTVGSPREAAAAPIATLPSSDTGVQALKPIDPPGAQTTGGALAPQASNPLPVAPQAPVNEPMTAPSMSAPQLVPAIAQSGATPAAPGPERVEIPATAPLPLLSYASLVNDYISTYPEAKSSKAFAETVGTVLNCHDYRQAQNNEFSRARFLAAAVAQVQQLGARPSAMRFRFHTTLGEYDAARQAFAFNPHLNSQYLNINAEICAPLRPDSGAPTSFRLHFQEASQLDGLPLPPDQAEAFIRSRTNAYGGVNRDVVVELTLEWRGSEKAVPSFVTKVELGVADMRVFADEKSAAVLAALDPAKKAAAQVARKAREATEAEDARNYRGFDPKAYAQEVSSLQSGQPPSDPRAVRWTLNVPLTQDHGKFGPLEFTPILTDDKIRNPAGHPFSRVLRIINVDEVNAVTPPAAAATTLAKAGQQARVSLIYKLVGYLEDPEAGAQTVLAHVEAIEVEVFDENETARFRADVASKSRPVSLAVDARGARDFDAVGARLRQSPEAVKAALEKAFGEKLVYDEATHVLVSSNPACATAVSLLGQQQASAARCIVGYFAPVEHSFFGSPIQALVRLEIGQRFDARTAQGFFAGLRAQFGEARARHTDGSGWFDVWGQKLAPLPVNAPATPSGAPVPLTPALLKWSAAGQHVAQLEVLNKDEVYDTRFILTDPEFVKIVTAAK